MPRRIAVRRIISRSRIVRGCLLSALTPGVIFGLFGAAETGLLRDPHLAVAGTAAFAAIVFYVVAPGVLCLGVPLFWLLRRLTREEWWAYALGGAIAAILWVGLLARIEGAGLALPNEEGAEWRLVLTVGGPGAVAGRVFWLTAYFSLGELVRQALRPGRRRPRQA